MKSSRLNTVLLVAVIDLVGFGLIIPLQGVYAERLGASGLVFGLLLGSRPLMALLFSPILGRWSDRVGRRPILMVSMAGSAFAYALFGLGDLAHSLPLLFAARLIDGVTGANISTAQACIADVTDAHDRAKGMGLFGAAMGLGFVIGPAIGGALAYVGVAICGPSGTSWPAFGAGAISLASLYAVWKYLPETLSDSSPSRSRAHESLCRGVASVWRNLRLRELMIMVFWGTLAIVLWELGIVYLSTKLLGFGEVGISFLFVFFGLLMMAVQGGLVGTLVRRFGEPPLVAFGPFITAIGMLMLVALASGASSSWIGILYIGSCIPIALGGGCTAPALHGMISRISPPDRQGLALGISQGLQSTTRAFGPPLAGLLFDICPHWPFSTSAIMLAVMGVYALFIIPKQRAAMQIAAAD